MDIEEHETEYVIEPLESPVPGADPAPAEPDHAPVEDPVEVPA